MSRMLKLLVVSFLVLFFFSGEAVALNLGEDITINDERRYISGDSWYTGSEDARIGVYEDNEVEPGMQTGNYWDLEGFFLDNNILSLVGGYDFKIGRDEYTSGDIFIDIDEDAVGDTPAGDQIVTDTFGYEYAIRLDFSNYSYEVFELDGDTRTQVIHYTQNTSSNPFKYIDGGNLISTQDNLFDYTHYNNDILGLKGGEHNVISGIDMGFLGANQEFWAHFTMECGNDNLMGHGTTPVPEPATMLLLGTGLLGIAGIGRKKLFKK